MLDAPLLHSRTTGTTLWFCLWNLNPQIVASLHGLQVFRISRRWTNAIIFSLSTGRYTPFARRSCQTVAHRLNKSGRERSGSQCSCSNSSEDCCCSERRHQRSRRCSSCPHDTQSVSMIIRHIPPIYRYCLELSDFIHPPIILPISESSLLQTPWSPTDINGSSGLAATSTRDLMTSSSTSSSFW